MNWNSLDLFSDVTSADIKLLPEQRGEARDFMWKDLCAEFDSFNLYWKIQENRQRYSKEFLQFIEVWFRDELNHANGFARIYQLLYGDHPQELFQKLHARPTDFSHLAEFLEDEFKLCLLIAYDELATTLTYHKDLEYYQSFGAEVFNQWIRLLKVDEAKHFSGCMKIVLHHHKDRLAEGAAIMNRILEVDLQGKEYKATFVLDHTPDCVHFQLNGAELSEKCAGVIIRKLNQEALHECA